MKRGVIGVFGLLVLVVLFLNLVAAELNITDMISLPTPQKDISYLRLHRYDFVKETKIAAYQCRLGQYPSGFPDSFDSQICKGEFLDITHDSALDQPDKNIVGGISWHNYATHHFFVLKSINEIMLKQFTINYAVYNGYHDGTKHYYVYVKNFETGDWELLGDVFADRLSQGFIHHESSFGDQSDYVKNNEMWFMGTEGPYAGNVAASDSFSALLKFGADQPLLVEKKITLGR